MARKVKVTYIDGREVVTEITQMWLVATERHFRPQGGIGQQNAVEATAFMAWVSMFKTGKESNDFEPWLELVDDVSDVEDEDAEPDPTRKAAGPVSASS